jgi:hypothetical protein
VLAEEMKVSDLCARMVEEIQKQRLLIADRDVVERLLLLAVSCVKLNDVKRLEGAF